MKAVLFAALTALTLSLRAESFPPESFAKGIVTVRGCVADVPASKRVSGVVRIRYICRGPVSLSGANILSYDGRGKQIRSQFLWPSVKLPDPSLWNVARTHLYELPADAVATNAVRVAMRYTLVPVRGFGDTPPAFEILSDDIEWRRAPRGVKPANWFTRNEDVVFRGELPPGKTGLRVRVTDDAGREAFAGDVTGGEWRWRAPEVGFYTVRFAWLDAAGRAEPAIESFASCQHAVEKGVHVLKREEEWPRDCQAFAVVETEARSPEEAPPMFGFNVSPKCRDEPFELVRLLGMSAFIRYHHFAWDKIEAKGRGKYDWSNVDNAFAVARRHGYGLDRILVNPFGTPAWLTTAPTNLVISSPLVRPTLYAPRDMAPWHDFIKAFVLRYPDMKYIELWNEPHLPGYSIFWQKSSPRQFVDLMKAGYAGAKEARQDITVLMGGQGMRYQPFYEEYVKLGGVDYFDQIDTHCGYNMQHFRETERRLGAQSKPYWEGEWHTVLYNCSAKERPDEATCAYRMLTNMADLINEGYDRITGFGLTCGDHTPETAAFFAKVRGIQQVSGLFRSEPFVEPRLAALALRVATDRFAGRIVRRGAWAFGDDGSERLAAFASDRGEMAFLWSANAKMKKGGWSKALQAAVAGRRILDWTGREVRLGDTRPLRVYFVLAPDLAAAASGGGKLDHLDYTAYNYHSPLSIARGFYTEDGEMRENAVDGNMRFAVRLTDKGLALDVKGEEIAGLRFAVDVVGKGQLQDVVEFKANDAGVIMKTRTPELMGDIPSAFSPAGVPLTTSSVKPGEGEWTASVSSGDLYPYVYAPHRVLPFSLVIQTQRGERRWGGGLGRFVKASEFGRLLVSGGNRRLADEKDWQQTKAPGFGWQVRREIAPGSFVRVTGKVRGQGRLLVAAWLFGDKGRSLGRLEAKSGNGKAGVTLGDAWSDLDMVWEMPPDARAANFRLFTWQAPDHSFDVRDLNLVNE